MNKRKLDEEAMQLRERMDADIVFLWYSGGKGTGSYTLAAKPTPEGTRKLMLFPKHLREIANKIEQQILAKEVYPYPPRGEP